MSIDCFATFAIDTVHNVQRIQACFGIDFQYLCVDVGKSFLRNFATVHKTGFLDSFGEILVVETVSAEAIAHVHVDNTPRGENGFLVGVFEHGKLIGNLFHPFIRR